MPEYPRVPQSTPRGTAGVRRRSDAPFASASPQSLDAAPTRSARSFDAAPTRSARSFDAAPTLCDDDDYDYDDDGACGAVPEGTHSAVGVP